MTTVAAKERGIPFTTESVRAILEWRKSQSRRVIQPQPSFWLAKQLDSGFRVMRPLNDNWWGAMAHAEGETTTAYACRSEDMIRCPYGKPGDVLYCKEVWSPDHAAFYPHFACVYKADYPIEIENGTVYSPEAKRRFPFKWRSPRFMPKWAARLRAGTQRAYRSNLNGVDADAVPKVRWEVLIGENDEQAD